MALRAPHLCHRPHRPSAPHPPRALPDLPDPATLGLLTGAVTIGLPLSVALDEALDTAAPRVDAIANARTAGGVRLFVSRPPQAEQAGHPGTAGGTQQDQEQQEQQQQRRPAVILIHQILGLQRREADLAAALAAAEGVVVVAPDTFRGQSSLWPFRAILLGWRYALRPGAAWGVEDVAEVVRWLASQPDVDPKRIVVAGFCYGGGAALRYAAAYSGTVAGVGVFYGRPLLEAADVARLGSTPVLGLYGTRDSQFPPAMLEKFEADLAAAGVPHKLVRFEGEGHAFVKDAVSVQRGGAAGRAWEEFRAFVRSISTAQ